MHTLEKIDYELGDTDFIPEYARVPLSTALSYLPEKVIDFVIEKCVFVSLEKDYRGIHLSLSDFRLKSKQNIILLSNVLWFENKKAITFVVAHEVAHAYLRHGFVSINDTNHAVNIKRERSADKQAIQWLQPHFTGSFKRYVYKSWQLQSGKKSN